MEDLTIAVEDLETFCAEEGVPVAPHEWGKGWEHALRIALSQAREKLASAAPETGGPGAR